MHKHLFLAVSHERETVAPHLTITEYYHVNSHIPLQTGPKEEFGVICTLMCQRICDF